MTSEGPESGSGTREPRELASGELILDYSAKPYRLTCSGSREDEGCRFVWNRTYLLGSDSLGRDMMARLMYGARISLLVAVIAALAALGLSLWPYLT